MISTAVDPYRASFADRLRMVRRWVCQKLGTTSHEQRVSDIAVRLFDLTAERHGLGTVERRILKLAALLHDVGRCHGARRHHIRGARMILGARELPLKSSHRRIVAYLTRYHRGGIPDLGDDSILADTDDARTARSLLAILRAADALDSRRTAPPTLVLRLKDRRLRVRCYVTGDRGDVYQRPRKFRLLEELFAMRVTVDVHPATSVIDR